MLLLGKNQNINQKQPSMDDYLYPTAICKWKIKNGHIDYSEDCNSEFEPCFCSEDSFYENHEYLLFSVVLCIICFIYIVISLYSILFGKQRIDQEEYVFDCKEFHK